MNNYYYFIDKSPSGKMRICVRVGSTNDYISRNSRIQNIDCIPTDVFAVGNISAISFAAAKEKAKDILNKNQI